MGLTSLPQEWLHSDLLLRLACFPQPVPVGYARAALSVGLRPHSVRHAALDLDHVYADLRLLSAGYADVELPVVVIGGVQDRIAPFGESVAFQRHLPNARLLAVGDGGHALHVTHPSEVLKAIDLAVEMAARPAHRPRLAAAPFPTRERRPSREGRADPTPLDGRQSLAAGEAVA